MAEKKVITKTIDYVVLNQLSKDFKTRFVPQTELSAEQGFWSCYSVQPEEPNLSALGFQNPCYLKKAQQLKPTLYDGSVIGKSDVIVVPDSENTLMHAEESRSKMIEKQNDPQMIEKKVITKPIDYAILNQLSTDFNTRFVPQTESYAEQAFWSQYSVQTDEPNHSGTTIVKVPKELPKVSMVNSCLKKLKFHLASFDIVVKERTTATAITEGTWGFEHTKACFRDDIIPFVKNLKELFTSFDQCLIDEVTERDTVSSLESAPTVAELFKINDLKAQVQEKDIVILKLKEKLKSFTGDVKERKVEREVKEIETLNLELDHKVDVALLVPKLRKNRTAHIDYIRHTQEEAATLREIIESERFLSPLNTSLAYASYINSVNARKKSKSVKTPVPRKVVQIVLWYLDFGCSKHMTGDRSQLINFVQKFLGTVKFGNDHMAKIMGYGDYQIGNVTISRVYYVEGLGHNLFSVGQFCDLEVAFRQHICFIRNLEGV
nr:integrase, catalytic region, zinc finger, CCHC-type, peptidase aspartic, catalytic [Tanacetum cinerariifolium]